MVDCYWSGQIPTRCLIYEEMCNGIGDRPFLGSSILTDIQENYSDDCPLNRPLDITSGPPQRQPDSKSSQSSSTTLSDSVTTQQKSQRTVRFQSATEPHRSSLVKYLLLLIRSHILMKTLSHQQKVPYNKLLSQHSQHLKHQFVQVPVALLIDYFNSGWVPLRGQLLTLLSVRAAILIYQTRC